MEVLNNQKFNSLVALKPVFRYKREWVWECKCDCGNYTNVRISKLKNGTTKSCGCFKLKNLNCKASGSSHSNWKGYKFLSLSFYSRMKQTAIQRRIEFDVSIGYLYDLFENQDGRCAYTGEKLFLPVNVRQLRGEANENIASLDRIENDKGYIAGNLHWVCKRVNYMKHSMHESYFLEWVKKIYKHKLL